MQVQAQTKTTGRFIDAFPYVPWIITGILIVALMAGAFMERTLISTNITVDPDSPAQLAPIQIKKERFGALRIDVVAGLPANRWVTYEIQLKDPQGTVLASGFKEAWSETGTWAEDGETGSWAEDDLLAGLDVRTDKPETVTISLDVLDYTDTTGREVDAAVPFRVTVKNGAIDDRYLWTGFVGVLVIAVLTAAMVSSVGKLVINRSNRDSDAVARTTLGGAHRLLRVVVEVKSDEHSPREFDIQLTINDANGEQIYSRTHRSQVSLTKKDGEVTGGKTSLTLFFVLEPRDSYGFHVDVRPDGPIDRTRIVVRENAHTLFPVQVTTLKLI